jgi:hypothetical protein
VRGRVEYAARVLDGERFPRATEYLRHCPRGFESRPDCQTLAEAHAGAAAILRDKVEASAMPGSVRALVEGDDDKRWLPEVIGMTAEMMVADLVGDQAYARWCYDDAMSLFQRPIIRHLMRLVSPTLVVMGARSRWGAVHKGTTLSAKPVQREGDRVIAESTLGFPEHHYPRLFLEGLAHSFRAAIDGARGKQVESELVAVEPQAAHYRVSWAR